MQPETTPLSAYRAPHQAFEPSALAGRLHSDPPRSRPEPAPRSRQTVGHSGWQVTRARAPCVPAPHLVQRPQPYPPQNSGGQIHSDIRTSKHPSLVTPGGRPPAESSTPGHNTTSSVQRRAEASHLSQQGNPGGFGRIRVLSVSHCARASSQHRRATRTACPQTGRRARPNRTASALPDQLFNVLISSSRSLQIC